MKKIIVLCTYIFASSLIISFSILAAVTFMSIERQINKDTLLIIYFFIFIGIIIFIVSSIFVIIELLKKEKK